MSIETARINTEIRSRRVIVIDTDGTRVGEFFLNDAIAMAEHQGFDLVELSVSDDGEKSTCKIADYGKLLFDSKKKKKDNRQTSSETKEIWITPRIEENDLNTKANKAKEFLSRGDKVRFVLKFKGRELSHQKLAFEKCEYIIDLLKEVSIVESAPRLGSDSGEKVNISMLLVKR